MKEQRQAPAGLYTAAQAIRTIGIPHHSFYNLVEAGSIKKVIPPGKKEAFYSKAEVDTYARDWKAFNQFNASAKLTFGLALIEDLPYIHELVASVSGGYAHAVPIEILAAWIRKNPQSIHILRKQSEIVGYISMFPLQRDVLVQRLDGTLFNRSIPIDAILPFNPNTDINLYIAEMAVKHAPEHLKDNEPDPANPDKEARKLGYRLIIDAWRFIAGLDKQDTRIHDFYAVGTTQFGLQMCTDLGMHVMDLPTGVRDTRKPFGLDMESSRGSILVRKLRRAA